MVKKIFRNSNFSDFLGIRSEISHWSVQSHVPNWFRDMEGKVPIDEMEEIAIDWLDDLITRYDGKACVFSRP